jgi:hypothetical protein
MSTFTYNGHTYLLTDFLTWQAAETQAVSLGGHLVTINDAAEETALMTWLTTDYSTEALTFWIGYTDQVTEGMFQWINGETSSYTHWSAGEPNDYGGNEDYAQMQISGSTVSWNDLSGIQLSRGIIEIPSTSIPDTTPPSIGGIASVVNVNDNATTTPFSTISIADASLVTAKISLDNAAKGTLTGSGFSSIDGGLTYTFASYVTAAELRIALQALVYQPATNRVAVGSTETTNFTITVTDASANMASVNLPQVISTSINDAPTFTAFSAPIAAGNEDSQIAINFVNLLSQGNAADVDVGGSINAFVVKAVSSGTLKIGLSALTATDWNALSNNTIDATHQAYWTPDINASDVRNAFTVVARDDGGLESATAVQAAVNVVAIPDVNVTAGVSPIEGTTGTFVFSLDSPAPFGGLTVNYALAGTATLATDYTITAGANVIAVTGSSSFTIAAGASSAVLNINALNDYISDPNETVILTLTTGSTYQLNQVNTVATLTITDVLSNTAPVAVNDTLTATEDTPITYLAADLLGNDTDADKNPLTLASVTSGTNGIAVLSTDGKTVLFTPNENFNGVANFTYQASDGLLNSNSATVTVNVAAVNDAPAGADKTVTINQGSSHTVTVADFGFSDAKDSPANAFLNVKVSSLPATTDGVYTFNNSAVSVGQSISMTDINAGKLIFTPATDKNGTGLGGLGFKVQDDGGVANGGVDTDATANTLNFNITAVNPNHAPTLTAPAEINYTDTKFDDSFSTATGVLVAHDVDGDSLAYGIAGGTNSSDGLTISISNTYGELIVTKATGDYRFVPNDAGIEALTADTSTSFTVMVSDSSQSDSQTLTINMVQKGITESLGDDVLIGTCDDDKFNGLAGDDIINGLAGNDIINGGAGADRMIGGAGDDTYYVDNGGDNVIEQACEGEDTVYTTIDYTLAPNVENLVLMGTAAITGLGNELNNHLTGNGAGSVLNGLGGNDNYYISKAGDTIAESAHNGWDTVLSSIDYTLETNLEELYLMGTANLNGTGNDQDNILHGNIGNNTLVGGLGQDSYYLKETTAATDTLGIAKGDSLINSYDIVFNFALGTGTINTVGVDKLDLASTAIAADTAGVNGDNAGIIHSHSISNGIISFDDVNHYNDALTIDATNLTEVFSYLQANITDGNTVAFVSDGNTFVFQDGGVTDTLVELVGVTATSLSHSGLANGAVWIV